MRILPALVAATSGLFALTACQKTKPASGPACPTTKVTLGSWERHTAKFWPVSFVAPPGAMTDTLPKANGARGEMWNGSGWHIYYRIDSTRTEREIEKNELVEDFVTCKDSVGGYPVAVTLLYSTATSTTGELAQGTWTLPGGRTFYLATLTANRAARDTAIAVLRSVRFEASPKP